MGPSSSSCPGSFPKGFIPALKRKFWGKRRLWVCSGGFHDSDGITLDIRPEVKPTIVANAEQLPFADESFDFVMADPPYSEAEAKTLYGLAYLSMTKLINEMIRVCEPNGYIILLHRLIPGPNPQTGTGNLAVEGVVGVGVLGAWANIRALTVFRKRQPLESWEEGFVYR